MLIKIKTYNKSALTQAFSSLRSRNYRLYFSISLIGTWMQQVAMSWLIYRLTDSVLLPGTVAFVNQTPSFLISSFAGIFAEYPKITKYIDMESN